MSCWLGPLVTITSLDHVNVRTANLERLLAFYTNDLGLRATATHAARRGYWLGIESGIVLHLIEADATDRADRPQIEHFGFRAEGLADFLERLRGRGTDYRLDPIAEQGVARLQLRDPDGNRLHLDFPLAEYSVSGSATAPGAE